MVSPAFTITKPPKVCYSSTSGNDLVIKDSEVGCGLPLVLSKPRLLNVVGLGHGSLHAVQENTGPMPSKPATGVIQAFQFGGAEGVHGSDNDKPQSISLSYIAGRTPAKAVAGDIRKVVVTDPETHRHTHGR